MYINFRKDIWGSNFAKEFRDNSFCTYINMQYLFKGIVYQFSEDMAMRSHAAAGVTGPRILCCEGMNMDLQYFPIYLQLSV